MPRRIDGNHALYHYIQKIILPREDEFSRELVRRLVLDLAIWLPPEFYRAVPVLFPYCVRAHSLKGREWGTPDAAGRLRDNNSILKRVVGSYAIQSPLKAVYPRSGRGRNFIACHIWRRIHLAGSEFLTTSHPYTYSFIPNLVWLPAQVAKLTDHEGSYAQRLLQSAARQLYFGLGASLPGCLGGIWEGLSAPVEEVIDPAQLNYFAVSERSLRMRRRIICAEIEAILAVLAGGSPPGKPVRSVRYLPGLARLARADTSDLRGWLHEYQSFLQAA